jgi:fructosamine-3-kinase
VNREAAPDFAAIGRAITAANGDRVDSTAATPVSGGSISRAWRLPGAKRHYFVKTHAADFIDNFTAEAEGLKVLASAVSPAPTLLTTGATDTTAFLVLEYLELRPLDRAGGTFLGHQLSTLHRVTGEAFGWHRDNFIGATPQANEAHASWPHFFAQHRLLPQLRLASKNGMVAELRAKGEALVERIGGLFIDYRPRPSLLHGDLWSGNAAQLTDGRAVMFDPACYFGDREADLAMSELFGGFPESFYAAYREAWPLDHGYEARKPLYNLYHVLNHYNLFGDAYLGQARRMIERLLAELKR